MFRGGIETYETNPDINVYGANMGSTWVLSAPGGTHVGPINLAIREETSTDNWMYMSAKSHPICWTAYIPYYAKSNDMFP